MTFPPAPPLRARTCLWRAAPALLVLFASYARADGEPVNLQVRIIEASRAEGATRVDARLAPLDKDLRALPFTRFELQDSHEKTLRETERASFEFPGQGPARRFLVVTSQGRNAGGKLRFQMQIAELKFDTLVAVPEGGTLLVGGPRHGEKTLVFAVTAKSAGGGKRGAAPGRASTPAPAGRGRRPR